MEPKHRNWLILAGLIILALWVLTPFVVRSMFSGAQEQGTFGDLYGSINSLFSGAALIGVVAAILLQQKELSLSTTELRNSASALKKQVELSADAARIQALPSLIQMQKIRIRTEDEKGFNNFENENYNNSALMKLLHHRQREMDACTARIKVINEELLKPIDNVIHAKRQNELTELQEGIELRERTMPEIALLMRYQDDLIQIYDKISRAS